MNQPLVELQDICRFISGGTPSTKVPEYFAGTIPWITGADMNGNVITEARQYITEEAIQHSATNIVPKGNILLVTRTGVGKVAIAGVDICISQDFTGLELDKTKVDEWYLFYFLLSQQEALTSQQRGATIQGITRDVVETLRIPLPLLTEQKRIASLLARADRLRQLRQTAHDLGDALLQSVFLEMFGDPETNPKKWKVGHIRDLCEKILDCPHETPIHSETETEYASIRSSDIQNGHLDFSTTKYVSYEVYKRRIERGTPMPGDVVYCREGARFGNAARIPENLNKKICLGQRMMSFRVNPQKATSEFLWAILESASIYKQAVNMVGGSAAPHVNVQDIKKFNIIIPPLSLQEEFAGVVARVESLHGRMGESTRQVEGLFESLLSEAFNA